MHKLIRQCLLAPETFLRKRTPLSSGRPSLANAKYIMLFYTLPDLADAGLSVELVDAKLHIVDTQLAHTLQFLVVFEFQLLGRPRWRKSAYESPTLKGGCSS